MSRPSKDDPFVFPSGYADTVRRMEAMEKVVEAAKRWRVAYFATDGSYTLNKGEAMEARQGLSDALAALASLPDAKEPEKARFPCGCVTEHPSGKEVENCGERRGFCVRKADAKEPCRKCQGIGSVAQGTCSMPCPKCQPSGDERDTKEKK